jgi:hypothetical protein
MHHKNSKDSKSVLIVSIALVVIVEFLAILLFFNEKVTKHISEQWCHLAAETGS